MKLNLAYSLRAVASAACALVFVLSAQAQNATPRTVLVRGISGDARWARSGGEFVNLAEGTRVGKGDVIKTAANSHVDIDMGSNVGILMVAENTTFTIDEATITQTQVEELTETQVSISEGAVYAKVNKLAKGSRYEISTPKGIAGIRGTSIFLTAAGQLTVEKGLAGIAFGPGDVVLVHEGETAGPNDRPPHPASLIILRQIVEALRDCAVHGVMQGSLPFVPSFDSFISPILPGGLRIPTRG